METKTSNSVAVERRMDLASFFCSIARHGPAVVLAAIAVMSVLAAVIIYRTVRGKWRKSVAGNEHSNAGRDEEPQRCAEESLCSSTEPTGDEGWSEVKEDVIQTDLKIRHRRAPAEEKHPPFSPPRTLASSLMDSKYITDTYVEEATQDMQVDNKDVVCDSSMDKVVWNAEEDDNTDRRLKTELVSNEPYKEDEKVLQAEWQEVESIPRELDVPKEKLFQEEEGLTVSHSPECFEEVDVSENRDDCKLQDKDATPDTKSDSVEPVVQIEDAPVSHIYYDTIADYKEQILCPDAFDSNDYHENYPLHLEEDKEINCKEAEQKPLLDQVIAQQTETHYSALEEVTNITLVGEQQLQIEQKEEQKEICCTEEIGVLEDIKLTDCVSECENVVLDSLVSCFNHSTESKKIENGIDGLCGTTNETKVEISGIVDCPVLSSDELSIENVSHGQTSVMGDEVRNESNLNSFTEIECDVQQLQMDGQQIEAKETKEQHGLTSEKVEYVEDTMHSSCSDEWEVVALESAMLSMTPEKVDNEPMGISAVVDFPILTKEENGEQKDVEDQMLVSCGHPCENISLEYAMSSLNQSAEPEENKETTSGFVDTAISSPEYQEPQIEAEEDKITEVLEYGPNICLCTEQPEEKELGIGMPKVEDVEDIVLGSYDDNQQNDTLDNKEVDTMVNPGAPVCEELSFSPVAATEIPHFDTFSHIQSVHMQNSTAVPEATADIAQEKIEDSNSQPPLLSFEQNQLTWSGFGGESGISSMAVSPDSLDAFDTTLESGMPPAMDCNPYFDEWTGAQNNLFVDDAVVSFAHEVTANVEFKSDQPADLGDYSSLVVNEDIFGSEVESSYHSEMDQSWTQMTTSSTSSNDEIVKETDMKAPFVEIKEAKEEAGKVEDNERTEISIMEATMDHNEWITDGNYQVLPWMNLSASSFAPNLTKTDLTEEHPSSSSFTDITCTDTNLPSFTETTETSAPPLVEENTENIKMVMAVQPVPHNVNVTFHIHYFTKSQHQMVAITGDHKELGNWKEFIPLERAEDGNWSIVMSLPTESHVEWKFVVVEKDKVCRWEECGNRQLDTGCGDELVVHRWWGIL